MSQATEIVGYVTGAQAGRAKQIARALIDAGVLPISSGRDIKKISAKELLPLFAAVAMADKVADAPKVGREFSSLPLEGKADGKAFSDLFAVIMEQPDIWKRAEIEFSRQHTGYTAIVRGTVSNKDGEDLELSLPFWRNPSWGHFYKTSFTVSAEGIEVMRNLFARDDIEGRRFALVNQEPRT